MRLTDFDVLTFDCYGTLIDWESGIATALQPLLQRAATPVPREAALEAFARHESAQEAETPGMLYPDVLAAVHGRLAAELGLEASEADNRRFGASVPDWPEFPDSRASLEYLKAHYKLVILSNVDRESFKASNVRLGVEFDAVYTAQDIGSYKPNMANFDYMLTELAKRGIRVENILHTAQSLFHDHVPARKKQLATAWIDRRGGRSGAGATMPVPPPAQGGAYDFRFTSLHEMAAAHRHDKRC